MKPASKRGSGPLRAGGPSRARRTLVGCGVALACATGLGVRPTQAQLGPGLERLRARHHRRWTSTGAPRASTGRTRATLGVALQAGPPRALNESRFDDAVTILARPEIAHSEAGEAAGLTSLAGCARVHPRRRSPSATSGAASRCATRTRAIARSRRSSSTRWRRRAPRPERGSRSHLAAPDARHRGARPPFPGRHDRPPLRIREDHGHGRRREVGPCDAPQPARDRHGLRLARHAHPRAHPPRRHAPHGRPRAALAPGGDREARRGPLARAGAVRRTPDARSDRRLHGSRADILVLRSIKPGARRSRCSRAPTRHDRRLRRGDELHPLPHCRYRRGDRALLTSSPQFGRSDERQRCPRRSSAGVRPGRPGTRSGAPTSPHVPRSPSPQPWSLGTVPRQEGSRDPRAPCGSPSSPPRPRSHAADAVTELEPLPADTWDDASLRHLRARAFEAAGNTSVVPASLGEPKDIAAAYGPWWAIKGRICPPWGDGTSRGRRVLRRSPRPGPARPGIACETLDPASAPAAKDAKALCDAARHRAEPGAGKD